MLPSLTTHPPLQPQVYPLWCENNMDGPRDYHTKQSKSERERQIPYVITYMWNLNYDTNEHIYKTETDSQT